MNLYEVVFWGRAGARDEEDTIYLVRAEAFSDAVNLVMAGYAEPKDHGREKYSLPDVVYEIGRDLSLGLDKSPRFLGGPFFNFAYNFGWRSWKRCAEDGTETETWHERDLSGQLLSEQSAEERTPAGLRVDVPKFVETCERIQKAGGGTIGPWSPETAGWFSKHVLPKPLQQLFQDHMSKTDIWAGAGTLFGEANILKWNDHFPEAWRDHLLIVGSAPNGDHIAIDLIDGGVGYISHEHDWRSQPRDFFVPVSISIGSYMHAISQEKSSVPGDYWQAKEVKRERT